MLCFLYSQLKTYFCPTLYYTGFCKMLPLGKMYNLSIVFLITICESTSISIKIPPPPKKKKILPCPFFLCFIYWHHHSSL